MTVRTQHTQRRRLPLAVLIAVLASLASLAGGCGGDDAPVVDEATLAALDAPALIAASAEATAQQQRFRFVLSHEHGATAIVRGIEMDRAEGTVDGADRMAATIEGSILNQRFEFGIVILEDQSWLQNPLTRRWDTEDLSLGSLFDPRSGVIAAVQGATDARLDGTERLDGVETYRIDATVDAATLSFFSPDASADAALPGTVWIGIDDGFVRRLEVRGAIAPSDDPAVVRRLDLGRYGEDVDIQPPR